jgi:hypothetical protein
MDNILYLLHQEVEHPPSSGLQIGEELINTMREAPMNVPLQPLEQVQLNIGV